MLLSVSFTSLTPEVWKTVHDLTPEFEPPPWDGLLLDAQEELPKIGTAVVLAATALEVFISQILDQLAAEEVVPPELWTWINDRGDHRLDPSVTEQFDRLLEFFTGHSLKKEVPLLWECVRNLRDARNTFVHQGTAMIGNKPLETARASELIAGSHRIVDTVREWLPEKLQWPKFRHEVKLQITSKPFPREANKA